MTDLRERLAALKTKAEAAILDDTREDFDAEEFGNEIGPYVTAALLDVAEAALPFKERAMLRHMPELDAALSRLSTVIGGQHE